MQCGTAGSPATPASSGGGRQACTWVPDAGRYWPGWTANAPPAPAGYVYVVELCGTTFGLPQLAAAGAALTPAILAQRAYAELTPPLPNPRTAPPRGSQGHVGLPEWFWLPAAQWVPRTVRIAAGPVWAQVTATPADLTFSPGAGLAAVSCPGPGTAYNPGLPAAAQQSSCTYTYVQSSDGLAGSAYQVSVAVTWAATWRGSGGSGGTFAAITRTAAFALPVAEAQALNPGS